MKKITVYLLAILCGIVSAQAQVVNVLGTGIQKGSTWYAVYEDTEYIKCCSAFHHTIHHYTYSVPGAQLTLQAKIPKKVSINGEIYINADESESAVYTISRNSLSTSYQTFGPYSLPRDQRGFYVREGDGSLDRYIKNVHLTMASYLDAPSATSLSFSNQVASAAAETKTFSFDWCNTGTVQVTYSGDDAFAVTTTSIATDGKYGNATISVTYNHTKYGSHTGTVTVTNGSTTYTIALSGSTTALAQTLTWAEPTLNITTDDQVQCNATASSGLPITYQSSAADIAEVNADGSLFIHAIGDVTITASQAGNDLYAAATPVSYTFHIAYPVQEWLCILPQNGAIGGDVSVSQSDTIHNRLLYWGGTSASNLHSNEPIAIAQEQYILMPIEADRWMTFVPAFDVDDVQVLEIMPESELQNLTRTEAMQRQQERTVLLAEAINNASKDAALNQVTLQEMLTSIFADWTTQYGYADGALGIYPLTHYNGKNIYSADYYAYSTVGTWDLSEETQSGLQKQWTPVSATSGTIFEQSEVYTLQFPYCTGCGYTDNYDYWSGKLLLMSHTGAQDVYGENEHATILATTPEDNKAALTGNYTLCNLQATDVYMHDTDENSAYYDCYVKQASATVQPMVSMLYANIPTTQRRSPVAVRRNGEVLYEVQESENTTTAQTMLSADPTLQVASVNGLLSLLSSTDQAVSVYSVSGALVQQLSLSSGQSATLNLPQGTYILHTPLAATKVMVR